MLKLHCNNNGVKALYHLFNCYHRHLFYSNFSSSISNEGKQSFANYFVESLGFSKQNASSTSAKLVNYMHSRGYNPATYSKYISNAISVVDILKQNGLDDSQIRKAVSSYPKILILGINKTLKSRIDYFLKSGFSKSDFGEVVSFNADVLLRNKYMKAVEVLKDVMNCDADVISIFKKAHWMSVNGIASNLSANVALLRDYEVPIELIRKRLLVNMSMFLRKTEILEDLMIRVEKNLGIPRGSPRFLNGVCLLANLSEETMSSKIKMFEDFGWAKSDVLELIRKNPFCLALSEARLKRSLEYLMGKLGYDRSYLISHSAMFGYSLEKRIVPRNKILLALKEKGLIKMDHSLYATLSLPEPVFVKKYVLLLGQGGGEIYAKHLGESYVNPLKEEQGSSRKD